jgi:hypothetical protein
MAGRPFKNSHDHLWNVNDYSVWFMPTLLNDTQQQGEKGIGYALLLGGAGISLLRFATWFWALDSGLTNLKGYNWEAWERGENPVTKPLMTQYLRVRDAGKMGTTRNGIRLS